MTSQCEAPTASDAPDFVAFLQLRPRCTRRSFVRRPVPTPLPRAHDEQQPPRCHGRNLCVHNFSSLFLLLLQVAYPVYAL